MTTLAQYHDIRKQADSVREIDDTTCQVIPGNNDGYFIQAFGLQYRFASIDDAQRIATFFLAIVAFGPIDC